MYIDESERVSHTNPPPHSVSQTPPVHQPIIHHKAHLNHTGNCNYKTVKHTTMKTNDILMAINNEVRNTNYREFTPVSINGQVIYMTEIQVRALQVVARKKALESDAAFDEFTKDIVIYTDATCQETVTIGKDGRLNGPFTKGFYDATGLLSLELFRLQPMLKSEPTINWNCLD